MGKEGTEFPALTVRDPGNESGGVFNGYKSNEHSRSWAWGKGEVVWNRKLFAVNLYSHYQTEIQKQRFPDSTGLKNKETVQ